MSQAELATLAKTSQAAISAYESKPLASSFECASLLLMATIAPR